MELESYRELERQLFVTFIASYSVPSNSKTSVDRGLSFHLIKPGGTLDPNIGLVTSHSSTSSFSQTNLVSSGTMSTISPACSNREHLFMISVPRLTCVVLSMFFCSHLSPESVCHAYVPCLKVVLRHYLVNLTQSFLPSFCRYCRSQLVSR